MPFTREEAEADDPRDIDPALKDDSVQTFAQKLKNQLKVRHPDTEVVICYKGGPAPGTGGVVPSLPPMSSSDTVYVLGHGMEGCNFICNASWNVSKAQDAQVPGAAAVTADEIRQQMDSLGLTQGVGKIKLFSCKSAERGASKQSSLLDWFSNTGDFGETKLTGYKGSLTIGLLWREAGESGPEQRKISKVGDAPGVRASTNAVHIRPRAKKQSISREEW